jgi:dTDP-4-dehydrorhamnose reductase
VKILLTGVTGQVGYELERSLQGLGELIAVDRALRPGLMPTARACRQPAGMACGAAPVP